MLEIHVIGTSNSGKSIVAKMIEKMLSVFNIENVVLDEFGQIVDSENDTLDRDVKKIMAMQRKYTLGNEILIKMIQVRRDSYADTKLSDKE